MREKKTEQQLLREIRDFFVSVDPLSTAKGICGSIHDSPINGDHCDICPLCDKVDRVMSKCTKMNARERRAIIIPYCNSKLICEKLDLI